MRPYNTYRKVGTDEMVSSVENTNTISESNNASLSADLLRSLSEPISVDSSFSTFSPLLLSPGAEKEAEKPSAAAVVAPKTEIPARPQPVSASQYREPPILAQVPDLTRLEKRAVAVEVKNVSEKPLAAEVHSESNIAESKIEEKPLESQTFEELMATAAAGIEKMQAEDPVSRPASPAAGKRGFFPQFNWGKARKFLQNRETLKLSLIGLLVCGVIAAAVLYKQDKDANKQELAEFDVPVTSPAEPSVAVAAETPVAASSDFSGNSYAQLDYAPSAVGQESFTDQMRESSVEDYSSPEIYASDDSNYNSVPEARATFALSGEDGARQILPPRAQNAEIAAYPSIPEYSTAPEMASAAPAIGSQYDYNSDNNNYSAENYSVNNYSAPESAVDAYASPTLSDDFDASHSVPYTATGFDPSQIR